MDIVMSEESNVSRREMFGGALALGLLVGGASAANAVELIPESHEQGKKPAAKPAQKPAAKAATPAPTAPPAYPADPPKPTVSCAVIGLGEQGREVLKALDYLGNADIKHIIDVYEPSHRRAGEIAPKAATGTDYKAAIADASVKTIFVATPTHLHREIVVAALEAGKHVFCEAPIANTIEDARAIAQAAKKAAEKGVVFHTGLQERTNPQHHHVWKFVTTGVLGPNLTTCKSQWNKKTSWRKTAPNGAREAALNWRLSKSVSLGLVGEIGIHPLDTAAWFVKSDPIAVTGFGSLTNWKDGREVADSVTAVLEFANGVRMVFDATLSNSFAGNYEQFQGSDAAIMLKDPIDKNTRAWMIKEADATALGWEVYAYREAVGDDTGIALVADASKLLKRGLEPGKNRNVDPKKTPVYYACDAFLDGVRAGKQTESDAMVGYRATVVAIRANEAVLNGGRVNITKEDLTI